MKLNHKESVEEIRNFLDQFSITNPLNTKAILDKYSQAYKQFHSVLVWGHLLLASKARKDAERNLFYHEFISDLAQTQVLMLSGFYKPSRMIARSALENFFRAAILAQRKQFSSAKNTYQLIDILKKTNLGRNKNTKTITSRLIQIYKDLCNYVHSSSKSHMALKVPFSTLAVFEAQECERCISLFHEISRLINQLLYWQHLEVLISSPSTFSDYVADSIPRAFKRAAHNL